jgi:hypothetical protein
MSTENKTAGANRILDAIRAKRDKRTGKVADIEALEASLIADIDSFDLNAAERQALRDQQLAAQHRGLTDGVPEFPEILPDGTPRKGGAAKTKSVAERSTSAAAVQSSNLLDQLRYQAELRQRELHSEFAERSASNLAVESALKNLFFFLHDLVQQLNIVKPPVDREYVAAAGELLFNDLTWQEGFADYRSQAQSKGAMIELVTLSFQLGSPASYSIKRDGPGVERLRLALFDFGLQFTCKEFKNEFNYIERAEFEISGQISVSARWKADFKNGVVILESRNLERLGSVTEVIRPPAVDDLLLDEFGRLLLGMPNRFRELAKR